MCRQQWLQRYVELDQLIKQATKEKSQLKEKITKDLPFGTHEKEDFVINYQEVTSMRFDSTSFKEKHPNLYKDFSKPTTSERLTVKQI